jgi:Kdo2-lipid IVA lauroyltransferase/acyltransferase
VKHHSLKHIVEYAALRTVVSCVNVLPLRLALLWGASLGYAAWFLRIRRGVVMTNLRQAFPDADDRWRARTGARSYANFGRFTIEFARQDRLDDRYFSDSVMTEDRAGLPARLTPGGIALTFHFGNWELLGVFLHVAGVPTSFLVGEQHNPQVDRLVNRLRSSRGIRLITRDGAMREAFRAIRSGGVVCWLSDQDAGRNGVIVDFMGRPASTPRGAAAIALKLGCPIYPMFMVREGGRRHRFIVTEPIIPDSSLPSGQAERELTQKYTTRLEEMVRLRPDLYWWAHRRWKTTGLYAREPEKGQSDG